MGIDMNGMKAIYRVKKRLEEVEDEKLFDPSVTVKGNSDGTGFTIEMDMGSMGLCGLDSRELGIIASRITEFLSSQKKPMLKYLKRWIDDEVEYGRNEIENKLDSWEKGEF